MEIRKFVCAPNFHKVKQKAKDGRSDVKMNAEETCYEGTIHEQCWRRRSWSFLKSTASQEGHTYVYITPSTL